jgi:hypothetical protein
MNRYQIPGPNRMIYYYSMIAICYSCMIIIAICTGGLFVYAPSLIVMLIIAYLVAYLLNNILDFSQPHILIIQPDHLKIHKFGVKKYQLIYFKTIRNISLKKGGKKNQLTVLFIHNNHEETAHIDIKKSSHTDGIITRLLDDLREKIPDLLVRCE